MLFMFLDFNYQFMHGSIADVTYATQFITDR